MESQIIGCTPELHCFYYVRDLSSGGVIHQSQFVVPSYLQRYSICGRDLSITYLLIIIMSLVIQTNYHRQNYATSDKFVLGTTGTLVRNKKPGLFISFGLHLIKSLLVLR